MNDDDRKWVAMTGYEYWWQRNELWWQEMNVDDRKWMVITGNERLGQEISNYYSKWMEMTGNEWW